MRPFDIPHLPPNEGIPSGITLFPLLRFSADDGLSSIAAGGGMSVRVKPAIGTGVLVGGNRVETEVGMSVSV